MIIEVFGEKKWKTTLNLAISTNRFIKKETINRRMNGERGIAEGKILDDAVEFYKKYRNQVDSIIK